MNWWLVSVFTGGFRKKQSRLIPVTLEPTGTLTQKAIILSTWAHVYFGKPFKTVGWSIQNGNLRQCYTRNRPYINCAQKYSRHLWLQRISDRRRQWRHVSVAFGKMKQQILHAKGETDHESWGYWGASVITAQAACFYACRYNWCRNAYWNFGETFVTVKRTSFSRRPAVISAGQREAWFCTPSSSAAL